MRRRQLTFYVRWLPTRACRSDTRLFLDIQGTSLSTQNSQGNGFRSHVFAFDVNVQNAGEGEESRVYNLYHVGVCERV